ncbi:MAG: hypothetical protein IIA85_00610 [Nanoarchaeota archaeon]|nr:hypothetical protein [Nanoarchaeota archaeon]
MNIVKNKRLEKEFNEVEVFGVRSTFSGNIAGIILSEKKSNVVITNDLEKIPAEDYVFPIMVDREKSEELYDKLR